MKTKKQLNKIFVEIAKDCNTFDEMKDALRSLNSEGLLTSDEYDYITQNWDEILKNHGL